MIKVKNGLVLFMVLLIFWVLVNNSIKPEVWIPGILVAIIIALISAQHLRVFSEFRFSLKAVAYTLIYVIIFLKELILSNLDVARRVVSPKMKINPGIVEAKTKLKSPMARLILANSITLTLRHIYGGDKRRHTLYSLSEH
jgi:multicomponent Na+:H+ antiporter subunit E